VQFTAKKGMQRLASITSGARYMSSAQGRFTSPDAPFADQHPEDSQSWNMYSYALNNPLAYIDPTGMECVNLDNGTQGDDGQGTPCPGAQLGTGGDATVNGDGTYVGFDGATPTSGTSGSTGDDGGTVFSTTVFGGSSSNRTRQLACATDVAVNFGLGFIPGYNAGKLAATLIGISFNPVEAALGYKKAFTTGPSPLQAATGAVSAYSLYRWSVFDAAGGASALERLTNLAERASFAGKSASAQASLLGKIGNLSSLSKIASSAGTVANLLNVASAGVDLYNCASQQ
jgi:RHS repeat-associated protein